MNKIEIKEPEVDLKNYVISPISLRRQTILPTSYIKSFGIKDIDQKISHRNKTIKHLDSVKQVLIQKLEITIKEIRDDTLRNKIIKLKRDVFNNRESKDDSTLGNLRGSLEEDYLEYIKLLHNLNNIELMLKDLFNQVEEKERALMYEVFKNDKYSISKALKFIQPNIFTKYDKYIETPYLEHNAKLKKMDITLAKIFSRAATKTSPFSTLTYNQFVETSSNPLVKGEKKTVTRVNETNLYMIFDKVVSNPLLFPEMKYKLIPTLNIEGDKIFWTALINDNEESGKVYKTKDRLVSIKLSELVNSIYQEFYERSEFDYKEIINFMVDSQHNLDLISAEEIFLKLYRQSFFVIINPLPQNADNLLENCINKLATYKTNESRFVHTQLTNVLTSLESFDEENYYSQHKAFKYITNCFEEISNYLSIEKFDKAKILYQDAIDLSIGAEKDEFLAIHKNSLTELMKFLNVFNSSYLLQLLMAQKFKEKYGTNKINTKDHWEDILQILFDGYLQNIDILTNQVSVSELKYENQTVNNMLAVKNRFLGKIEELINGSMSKKSTINLNEEFINEIVNEFPKNLLEKRQSNSFFVQKSKKGLLVVNHIYEGNLIYFSRFLKLQSEVGSSDKMEEYITNCIKEGNLVDINSTYGFNANSRFNVTGKKIQILNTPDFSQHQDNLIEYNWMDTTYQFNNETGELDVYVGDEKLNIYFLGSLVPMLLPGVASVMSLLSRDLALYSTISSIFIDIKFKAMKEHQTISQVPRITFKDDLIISRKKWLIKSCAFVAYFEKKLNIIEILDQMREMELPIQFFVYNHINDNSIMSREKPQFIDVTSPTLIKLFKRLLKDNETLVIEEIMPDLDQELVEERIVEVTKKGRK